MITITTEIKHEIIDLVQSGKLDSRGAAVRYGIPESLIQTWTGGSVSPNPKIKRHTKPAVPQPHKPTIAVIKGLKNNLWPACQQSISRGKEWFYPWVKTRQGQVVATTTALILICFIAASLNNGKEAPGEVLAETTVEESESSAGPESTIPRPTPAPPTPAPPTPAPPTPAPPTPAPPTPAPPTPATTTPATTNPATTNPANLNTGSRVYKHGMKSTVFIMVPTAEGVATGTGFLIDNQKRLLATAYHVVDETEEVQIIFPVFKTDRTVIADLEYYQRRVSEIAVRGKVVMRLKSKDLALIQIDQIPEGFQALELSDNRAQPGADLFAIGNPGAAEGMWIFSDGKVRQIFDDYKIQYSAGQLVQAAVTLTDIPSNPGDSGGPVLNSEGNLVGLTSGGDSDDKIQLMSYSIDVIEIRAMLERYQR
jgi:S1-C subfamily serine protease